MSFEAGSTAGNCLSIIKTASTLTYYQYTLKSAEFLTADKMKSKNIKFSLKNAKYSETSTALK